MAAKKVGTLIKEARTAAGLSQSALAALVDGVSASDIGKAERGEKQLSNEALKAIAKATRVTQKSLLDAAKASSAAASAKGSSGNSKKSSEIKLTEAEKTLINAYRKADADTQKAALKLLKGEKDLSDSILGNLLTNVLSNLGKQ